MKLEVLLESHWMLQTAFDIVCCGFIHAYSCDADDRQVLCKGSSNCINGTEPPHSEGHSKTPHSCEYTASIALSASKLMPSLLQDSALLTLSPRIAICGVACFQLIAAIDHSQVFVGVQLVK